MNLYHEQHECWMPTNLLIKIMAYDIDVLKTKEYRYTFLIEQKPRLVEFNLNESMHITDSILNRLVYPSERL